jgi:hypothetical protein
LLVAATPRKFALMSSSRDPHFRDIRLRSTRLMKRYPTRAKVLIAIYAIATVAIALMIAFLL